MALFKRVLELMASALALVILTPLFALISVVIFVDDGRPIFYKQMRIGKHMREFALYKFRTMVNGSDRKGLLTSRGDSRLTPCGRFLRRWKLDELPQLFNVLMGNMQLVGCRPEVPCYVAHFRDEYEELLRQAPGLTDPASLLFRDEERLLVGSDFEQQYVRLVLPQKLKLSLEYQKQRTAWSDLCVLAETLFRIAAPNKTQGSLHGFPAAQD
jgi:lipopolysaccharide/colanic/teichoic acid biosynthesis glycosyltransferase